MYSEYTFVFIILCVEGGRKPWPARNNMNIYILGKYIPGNKSVEMGLQSVRGIGKFNTQTICKALGYQKSFKIKDLSQAQIIKLSEYITKNYLIETSLLDKSEI